MQNSDAKAGPRPPESPFSFHGPRYRFFAALWEEFVAAGDGFSPMQADRWLSARLRRERRFGQKDRRWYSEALFRCLRFGISAVACEELWTEGRNPPSCLADAPLFKTWTARTPEGWWRAISALGPFKLAHWLSPMDLAAKEHEVWQAVHACHASGAETLLAGGLPPALWNHLAARRELSSWGAPGLETWLKLQQKKAPLWLRLNFPARRDACVAALLAAGFTAIEWDGPSALAVVGTKGIYDTLPYTEGWIEIQDRASQRIGEALTLAPGAFVWDACAGGGGKSLQLAARLAGRGAVYVSDVRAYKLEEVKKRADRAGFTNIRQLPWDGRSLPSLPRALTTRGGFDAILADAPCSASGTWRRNPDARFRLRESHVEELVQIQRAMADYFVPLLRPGGELLYATCSWLAEENEELVRHWLSRHDALELVEMRMVGAPKDDADTMFYARFIRSVNAKCP